MEFAWLILGVAFLVVFTLFGALVVSCILVATRTYVLVTLARLVAADLVRRNESYGGFARSMELALKAAGSHLGVSQSEMLHIVSLAVSELELEGQE